MINRSEARQALDREIEAIRALGEEKGAVLYEILFRSSGVGLFWFEEKKAGPKPRIEKGSLKDAAERLAKYSRAMSEWTKRGLVVYKYYPTLSTALEAETKRLKER